MSKYRLNINFTGDDLETIFAAKQRVVLVKHTQEGADSKVAWVTFNPFMHNTVDWEENFAVYASTSGVDGGAKIAKLSDCQAQTQIRNAFDRGYFRDATPDSSVGPNTYVVDNDSADNPMLTFGLAQSVSVNGTAFANHPINAVIIPRANSAKMTPIEKIDVYLEANVNDSTVVSVIDSKSVTLTYSGDTTEITIAYDSMKGSFYATK